MVTTRRVASFGRALTVEESGWLRCAEAMAEAGAQAAHPLSGTTAGRQILGRGGGGDCTIELDRAAEEAMLGMLARHAPAPHHVVAEELGLVGCAGAHRWVTVDPVDGSLNAKRGLEPFCAAIAVADEPTLGGVLLGYVRDYARGHVLAAIRGAGMATSRSLDPPAPDTPVEVVLLEAGRPDRHGFSFADLARIVPGSGGAELRVRQIGSLALCLCHLATGVADLLVSPVPCRAVDVAGGLLMVREAGGGAAALDGSDLWSQPLDLERRAPFLAWRAGIDGPGMVGAAQAVFHL